MDVFLWDQANNSTAINTTEINKKMKHPKLFLYRKIDRERAREGENFWQAKRKLLYKNYKLMQPKLRRSLIWKRKFQAFWDKTKKYLNQDDVKLVDIQSFHSKRSFITWKLYRINHRTKPYFSAWIQKKYSIVNTKQPKRERTTQFMPAQSHQIYNSSFHLFVQPVTHSIYIWLHLLEPVNMGTSITYYIWPTDKGM